MQKDIEEIIVDIIKHELDLPDNYGTTSNGDTIPCVAIYTPNIELFSTDNIQITVKTASASDYSSRIDYAENSESTDKKENSGLLEVQVLNQNRMMQIDVYSTNDEARERFWEVSAALKSTYAQQQQEQYNFQLGTTTNVSNLSGLKESSAVNHYVVTFNALVYYQKSKAVSYYDKF